MECPGGQKSLLVNPTALTQRRAFNAPHPEFVIHDDELRPPTTARRRYVGLGWRYGNGVATEEEAV